MSEIDVVRDQLRPVLFAGEECFRVHGWTALISKYFSSYRKLHPDLPEDGDLESRVMVWYDSEGICHARGSGSPDTDGYIASVMGRTQFVSSRYPDVDDGRSIDWGRLVMGLPHTESDGLRIIHYDDRDWFVNADYLAKQIRENRAYRFGDGSFRFVSESSDLQELVRLLITREDWKVARAKLEEDWRRRTEEEVRQAERDRLRAEKEKKEREAWAAEHPAPVPKQIARWNYEAALSDSRPWSKWTKGEIIEVCTDAGLPESAIRVLRSMKLDEIRRLFLVYDETDMTGNDWNSEQQRHTRFYHLDLDEIKRLDGRLDGF